MHIRRTLNHKPLAAAILFLVVFFAWGLFQVGDAQAGQNLQDLQVTDTPQPTAAPAARTEETPIQPEGSPHSIGNETCLECHGQPGLTLELENGDTLDLSVAADDYNHSIHGEEGYACVQCHTEVGNYPHPSFSAKDRRDASLQLYEACKRCHLGQYEKTQDSVHAKLQAEGVREAAICTDCHTADTVQRMTDPNTGQVADDMRTVIPQMCANCHSEIYGKYHDSVHGAALIDEGNKDVPTCIDCHGVHNIEDPTTAAFRLKSPEMCGKCHADAQLMAKYGISTQVFDTYVSDFHGTTVTLFEKESPDAETNKAVCYDCHGIHDIQPVDDPETGLQIKENLLARCSACHPDATTNFPSAWLYHYVPSSDQYPLVYYVNLFYKILIPGVLGAMAVLVVMDAGRLVYNRIKRASKTPSVVQPEPTSLLSPSDPSGTPGDPAPSETSPWIGDEGTSPEEASPDHEETPPEDDSDTQPGEETSHG